MKRTWRVELVLEVVDDGTDSLPGYAATAFEGAVTRLFEQHHHQLLSVDLKDGKGVWVRDEAAPG